MIKPLDNLLVISIEQAVAAPLCTSRLADAGARVIKVERREGDFARAYDTAAKGESSYFTWLNQGKESVCLDFKQSDDAALLWSMIKKADVLVQNLSPGALARSGFTTDALYKVNRGLIICNISGYGDTGEAAEKKAYDLLVQAESGIISVSGDVGAPGRIGVSICDIGAGVTAYAAVLEALIKRGRTGLGESISVSLFDVAAEWMSVPFMHAEYGAGAPAPAGLQHPSIAPYGAFECADNRLVLISIQNEREWQRLCQDVLKAESLLQNPKFESNNTRVTHRVELENAMNEITRAMSADEFQRRLQQASIAFGAINSAADLASHLALRTRTVATSVGQSLSLPAYPVVKANDTHEQPSSTPTVGQHTEQLRVEFAG